MNDYNEFLNAVKSVRYNRYIAEEMEILKDACEKRAKTYGEGHNGCEHKILQKITIKYKDTNGKEQTYSVFPIIFKCGDGMVFPRIAEFSGSMKATRVKFRLPNIQEINEIKKLNGSQKK